MLEDDIAYVRLNTFGNDTAKDFNKALKELLANDPKGLVLDLRYNGGGLLQTAVDVLSELVDGGTVVYGEYSDGSKDARARPYIVV